MNRESAPLEVGERPFVRLCKALASFDRAFSRVTLAGARRRVQRRRSCDRLVSPGRAELSSRQKELTADLRRAGTRLDAGMLSSAARGIAIAAAALPLAPAALFVMFGGLELAVMALLLSAIVPVLAREVVLSYPSMIALKRASLVARSSTDEVNVMIMSIRHEASLPKAMAIASKRGSEFAAEIRECIWSVIAGTHSTFEDALHQLAVKWSGHCEELKPAVRAIITASCEGTEAGRRRALDRANVALVTGAKRRIEEYTLSLSVPSMVLFGIGILLPLMVGSFLPMLSWDLMGSDSMSLPVDGAGPNRAILQTVVVMNVVFPTIALLVAADAVSKHPMARARRAERETNASRAGVEMLLALACAAAGVAAALALTDGTAQYVSCVMAASAPGAVVLLLHGSRSKAAGDDERRDSVENLLFAAGARMVEGENLEAAMRAARSELQTEELPRSAFWVARPGQTAIGDSESNEERALAVVREAASRDEGQAGILAMDLAGYVRDIAELEAVLKRRLKPTLSMMRMTTHALAPIMLGVTHAIYVSLSSLGGGTSDLSPGTLFVILAAFLVEINAIVAYFAWGIGDRRSVGSLTYSMGACILVAVFIMSFVVLMTS